VDRFINDIALPLAIRDAPEARAGPQPNAARDDTCLVADDIAEQIASDDDAVESAWVLDHEHGGRVDELVLDFQLGELLSEDVVDDAALQAAGSEDVGLVERRDGGGGVAGEGEEPPRRAIRSISGRE